MINDKTAFEVSTDGMIVPMNRQAVIFSASL
jgi:hypothetical protein